MGDFDSLEDDGFGIGDMPGKQYGKSRARKRPMLCQGELPSGKKCAARGVVIVNNVPFCRHHAPTLGDFE